MKTCLLVSLTAAVAAVTLHAQDAPTDPKDKASYSIGLNIGTNMKRQGLDLNAAMIGKGFADAFSGEKPLMTEEEMKQTMQAFQSEMQTKMMAKHKEQGDKNKVSGEKFLEENKKKDGVVTLPSGLQYKVITAGKGEKPKASDTVETNYRGTLVDGTEFDSSYKRKETATFPVTGVIPGWTEALQLMPVGSKWQLFIPSNLAYGENAPPEIGANSTLIFEVELLGIKKPEAKTETSVTTEPIAAPTDDAPKKKK